MPDTELVFTIGCSGTDFGKKSCEFITEFIRGIIGIPYSSATINTWTYLHSYGAGSKRHFLRKRQSSTVSQVKRSFSGKPQQLTFWEEIQRNFDYVSGNSIDDNITLAQEAFTTRVPDNNTPFTVNLFGWSRGAATNIKIANWLVDKYPNVKINLFLLDPLSGPGHNDSDFSTIPGAVEDLTVTYAQGEAKFNLLRLPLAIPIDLHLNDARRTKVNIIRTPGMHNSAIKHGWGSKDTLEPIAIWDSLYQFLTKHGTKIDVSKMQQNYIHGNQVSAGPYRSPTNYELIEIWSQLACDSSLKQRGTVYNENYEVINSVTHKFFYNNKNFEKVFAETCPHLAYTINNNNHMRPLSAEVEEELHNLYQHNCHHTLQRLHQQARGAQKQPSWLSNKIGYLIKSVKNTIKHTFFPHHHRKIDHQYSQKFTSHLNLVWHRPMELPDYAEEWRNGILSICHDYMSRPLTRHHTDFFRYLAQICKNENPLYFIKEKVQAYWDENHTKMNQKGYCYNACPYIMNQISLVERSQPAIGQSVKKEISQCEQNGNRIAMVN